MTLPTLPEPVTKGGHNPPLEEGTTEKPKEEDLRPEKAVETENHIQQNIDGRKAAEDLLDLAQNEVDKEQLNDRFWETLRDAAINEIGLPHKKEEKKVKGMNRKQAASFRSDTFPSGKYMGMSVKAVEAKDPDYLKNYPYRKSLFQIMVEKYLNREPDPKLKKKRKK